MANNYVEIMKLVNQGNKMGLSNTITRDNGIPLDLSSVQESFEAAVIYAATKSIAYVGQPIAVGNKLYIISETPAAEQFTATDGAKYDNYLVEVGSKTEGDELTIDLVDGVLMLHGINLETTTAGMLPQVEVVDGKKQIKWVSISQIVEGDGNKITTLTSEDGSVAITTKEDTDASLVYDLSVTHPAAPEYAVAADERAEGATSTTYHLTKDGENVDVAIVVPDAYNDTALAGRIKTIEDAVNHETTGLAAHETRLTEVEKFFAATDPDKIDSALDTLIEIQKEIEADNASAEGMLASIGANTTAIEKLNGDATTDGSVAKAVADAEARVEETYATKQMLTDHSNTMDGKLAEYAKTADVNTELAKKIENATIVHTSEGVAEGVTKDGTTLKIVVDAYTKEETLTKIQEKITEINGGESAGEVLGQLNSYKETNDAAVAAINSKIGTPGVGQNDEGDTLYSLVAEAQTQADKGVTDAKTANDAITALTNGAVATNTSDITAIKGRLTTLETAKGDHETRIAGVEGRVTALEAEDIEINATLGTLQGNVTALQGEDSRLAGLISANTTEIGKKAAQTDVDAINAKIGTVAEDKTLVQMIADAQSAATYDDTEVKADIAANVSAIEAIYKTGSGVEGEEDYVAPTGALADEIVRAKAAEKANTDAIAALIGEDSGKTVRVIAAEEVAAIVDNAPEDFNTLKEIADYIASDKTNAANINNKLAAHDAILAGFGTEEGQVATVTAAIATAKQEAIDAAAEDAKKYAYDLPAATAELLGGVKSAADVDGKVVANAVYVDATSNVGSVKAVSTDVLVNGVEEFILFGGDAGVSAQA